MRSIVALALLVVAAVCAVDEMEESTTPSVAASLQEENTNLKEENIILKEENAKLKAANGEQDEPNENAKLRARIKQLLKASHEAPAKVLSETKLCPSSSIKDVMENGCAPDTVSGTDTAVISGNNEAPKTGASLGETVSPIDAVTELGEKTETSQSLQLSTNSPCQNEGGGCVASPGYPSQYGNNQACNIMVSGSGSLRVDAFVTENNYDKLTIDNTEYQDTSGPNGVQVFAHTSIRWNSDGSATRTGWKICPAAAGQSSGPTCGEAANLAANPSARVTHCATAVQEMLNLVASKKFSLPGVTIHYIPPKWTSASAICNGMGNKDPPLGGGDHPYEGWNDAWFNNDGKSAASRLGKAQLLSRRFILQKDGGGFTSGIVAQAMCMKVQECYLRDDARHSTPSHGKTYECASEKQCIVYKLTNDGRTCHCASGCAILNQLRPGVRSGGFDQFAGYFISPF